MRNNSVFTIQYVVFPIEQEQEQEQEVTRFTRVRMARRSIPFEVGSPLPRNLRA